MVVIDHENCYSNARTCHNELWTAYRGKGAYIIYAPMYNNDGVFVGCNIVCYADHVMLNDNDVKNINETCKKYNTEVLFVWN
jgi:hypothetical protein